MSAGRVALIVVGILLIIAVARGYQQSQDNASPQTTTYQWVECPAGFTPDPVTLTCN